MKTLRRTEIVYEMSPGRRPAARLEPGQAIRLLTEDAYSGTIKTTHDRYPAAMRGKANPATGPVFLAGAAPGDILAVEIISIRPVGKATMLTGPGRGPLGSKLPGEDVGRYPIRDGAVVMGKRRIPIDPMIGFIGVAPKGRPVGNAFPGEHGGNMDCNVIKAGSVVYLPVFVPGALLAVGDVHAVQAAGEVAICAAETKGEVILRAGIYTGRMITPAVETADDVFLIASARKLDRAEGLVLDKAYRYLTEIRRFDPHEAVRLLSLAGELEICQVVDPLKTLRVRIPRKYL